MQVDTSQLGKISTLSDDTQSRKCEADLNEAHDAAAQLQASVGRSAGGREISMVITKIDEAMLWLAAFNKTQES
jgi:hypothetical protein